MSVLSMGLRASLIASLLALAACQAPDTRGESQYQKGEAAKLNAELSKELEDERKREKEAAQ